MPSNSGSNKRPAVGSCRSAAGSDDSDSDSDDDFGPKPMTGNEAIAVAAESAEVAKEATTEVKKNIKKRRKLLNEQVFLDALPTSERYEKSYMHRDVVTHVACAKQTEFIITGSADGHVKFWKKLLTGIEFVKHFQAHLGPIIGFNLSPDGTKLATSSTDSMVKIFEVKSYDMSNILALPFLPGTLLWLSSGSACKSKSSAGASLRLSSPHIAVSDINSGSISIYNTESGSQTPLRTISSVHSTPVQCMCLNMHYGCVISIDFRGVIEYWSVDTFEVSTKSNSSVLFDYKSDTDLYDLAKSKTFPTSVAAASHGNAFAVFSADHVIRLFDFCSGKLTRKYDESVSVYTATADSTTDGGEREGFGINSMDLSRRVAVEKQLYEQLDGLRGVGNKFAEVVVSADSQSLPECYYSGLRRCNLSFDETGYFLIYATLVGVKVLNTLSNRVVRVLGKDEVGERFLSVAVYQGVPRVDTQFLLSRAGAVATATSATSQVNTSNLLSGGGSSEGASSSSGISMTKTTQQNADASSMQDPMFVCTSFNKRRFYCFSTRNPDESVEPRDVLNEVPTEEERQAISRPVEKKLPSEVVLRTSKGDITIKLFGHECPRTVENFVGHAQSGYYDNVIFHRVIKGFMLQTGDPLGDGTGGESIWGGEFEDEINRNIKHDRPYTVSMANSGPDTNGSQFFITTVPCAWLDGKHTVFGRVSQGFDVCKSIEVVKVNKHDKPIEPIKILGVDVVS